MTNTEIPQNGNVRPMTEQNMTNHNQQLQKIRDYLIESIALAANEIEQIDELLKQN
jgi:hypothetical protein